MSPALTVQKREKLKMFSFMIFIENSAIEKKLVFTSKTCKIWTTWPILMKFWYKKRQSMLFKGQSVWNPRYVASLGKSLTESGISGWWPGMKQRLCYNQPCHLWKRPKKGSCARRKLRMGSFSHVFAKEHCEGGAKAWFGVWPGCNRPTIQWLVKTTVMYVASAQNYFVAK